MSAPNAVPASASRGRSIFLIAAIIATVGIAAVFAPSWKTADNGEVGLLPVFASLDIDRAGPPSWDGRFVPYRNNKAELMLYDIPAKQSRRVLDHPASVRQNVVQFIVSPDGSQVAYLLESLDGPSQLKILNADGSSERLLFTDPKHPLVSPGSWSADGRSIAVLLQEKEEASSLGVINVADGSLHVLFQGPSLANVRFSLDGRFIAYNQAADIFVLPSAGGLPIGAVVHPSHNALIGWAPDGRLVFTSDRSGKNDIWAVGFHDGKVASEPQVLTTDFNLVPLGITTAGDLVYNRSEMKNHLSSAELDSSGRFVAPPAGVGDRGYEEKTSAPDYSPDGGFLAYVADLKDGVRLRIRTLATGVERAVPLPMPRIDQIRWYPDNRAILIRGGGSNHYGFYRVSLDGDPKKPEEPTPVLTDGVPNYPSVNMTFSRDGKYLYYSTLPSSEAAVLMRLDLNTGALNEVLRPKEGFLRLFSISPDGSRIAFVARPPGTSHDRIYVAPLSGGTAILYHETDAVRTWGGLAWADSKTLLFHRPDPYGLRLDDLIRLPLDGAPPQKLATTGALMRIAVHPDGHHIAWESQDWEDKLLAIHNLFTKNPTR